MNPPDLIKTARDLVAANSGKPGQASLHRTISTAYCALFHTLARSCADMVVGTGSSDRSKPAWRQTYRALDHREAKRACTDAKVMPRFPQSIQDFASMFATMQAKRHDSDYDPDAKAFKSAVVVDINAVEVAFADFLGAPVRDRRAFAVWVLLRDRRA